ncbi:Flagellar biosynthesis pathway, component FliR [Parvularcula bermudensis HTCC2503]|uniref:Flagellar biosynthesis pathway, component FliR n=1 Tax=Parvularcula bermudensis (strain ATCC BAA-594 / HTCC2503 / KCTC 12087) TaxID=314260 RepID=E0TH66_PARBH|nr:flagellar biosynthetic protein FliR [Parvularcula bermudensis]ADM09650.1 Flagellar biosynthesis pathway, component FliR [Parvularcula bermudensis HTCC2503]
MFAELAALIPEEGQAFIIAAVAIFARLTAMLVLLPGLGQLAIPVRVRLMAGLVMTSTILPVILDRPLPALAISDPLVLIVFEVVIGAALGYGFRIFIWALSIAGTIVAQSASLSQLFGAGLNTEPNPSVGLLLTMAGATLFMTMEFHVRAVGLIAESYELFPLGELPRTDVLAEWATHRAMAAFALGVSLSLPFLLVNFLYNIVLGMMNQAMPQMMVTFIGVPANVLAALLLLAVAMPMILLVWLARTETGFMGFW